MLITGVEMTKDKLKIACIGCGSRGRTYLGLAAEMKDKYEIVAGAEPVPERLEYVRQISDNPDFQGFANDEEILAQPKLADLMIVSNQDAQHVKSCLAAMKKGYDILVEKPIATNIEDVLEIEKCATELGRRVMVCHVLRYTPFYRKVKEIVESGVIGDVISVHMMEGVEPYHQAHSFVRGHWGVKEKSSPMIIAKCCHDMDILSWVLGGEDCKQVSSFGELSHYNSDNKPEGAPLRCTDGCPVGDTCLFNAERRYTTDQKRWLRHVWPLFDLDNPPGTEEIVEWLKVSPWGRCVYQCDNNVVDHQVVNCQFESGITASFTMTAFDLGRNIEIYGTKACLRGGDAVKEQSGKDIILSFHDKSDKQEFVIDPLEGGYAGHGGGDFGIIDDLYKEMTKENPADMLTSVQTSVISHVIGFAAEESRVEGRTIQIADFIERHS